MRKRHHFSNSRSKAFYMLILLVLGAVVLAGCSGPSTNVPPKTPPRDPSITDPVVEVKIDWDALEDALVAAAAANTTPLVSQAMRSPNESILAAEEHLPPTH